ncbi:ABC transporter substrate-binding protein [Dubosiella newyorkensis]|uniref:ABC transporter substrate-binding protein n=1 Tax=Dubosiella newyorkensis TaxID=1862672 RepID=UPI0023F5527B|nr:ABC transporter substrate-binding protein [Dubosiella newyorkensis]
MKSLKKVGVLFTLLITTLAMVGCASTTTEEKSTAMKTVQTDKGEVEIPENPKRIISDYYLGEFLAVGVKPIIASPYALNNPYLKDDIEGIEPMNITSSETTLEQFSAAKPDLIVTITEADYEKYSKIAPTVYIQDGQRSDDETFEYIASLVGKEKEAKDYIEQFLQKAEEHKQEIQDIVKDQTVSIVEVWPQQIYTMGSHFARGGRILYDLWDLKAPEKVQKEMVDGDKQYEVVSLEALPEYAGDFVLYGVLDGTDPAFVTSSNLWNSLPAVKNGKTLPYEQVSFMHRDPITQSKQLEIFIDFFEQFKE